MNLRQNQFWQLAIANCVMIVLARGECGIIPRPTGSGIITGVVRSAGTGQPLPGIEVEVTLDGVDGTPLCWWQYVRTDNSGVFVMSALPRGRFSIGANTRRAPVAALP